MKPLKLRTTISSIIDIKFQDPERAKLFFIDGKWKDYFNQYDSLEHLSSELALMFHNANENYSTSRNATYKDIEGFGTYYKHNDQFIMTPSNKSNNNNQYEPNDPGQITISIHQWLDIENTENVDQRSK